MSKLTIKHQSPLLVLALGMAACGAPVESDEPAGSAELLAEQATTDGMDLEVYADLESGAFVMTAESDGKTESPFAEHLDAQDATEMFTRLTGEVAPERLFELEAEFREMNAFDTSADDDLGDEMAIGQVAQALTADEFEDLYCHSHHEVCLTNRTGNATKTSDHRLFNFEQYAHSYRGTIKLRLDYKAWGKWRHGVTRSVREGKTKHQWVTHVGANRWSRGKIREASGDGYHWSLDTRN